MATILDQTQPMRLPPADRDWKQTFWSAVGILLFAGLLVAAAVYTAPTLLTDWQVRDVARPLSSARITDGRCSSKIVFHICDATLTLATPSRTVTRRVNYVFTGVHVGDHSVRVMADPARPDLVTTDLALDKLWNRTITLGLAAATLLSLIVLPIVATVRKRRAAATTG